MPNTPLVYLASPIDFVGLEEAVQVGVLRGKIAAALNAAGVITYNPVNAFSVHKDVRPSGVISGINNSVLDRCDGVLALFPEYKTIGVPMEIARAQMLDKPVVIVSGAADRSWSLQGGDAFTELVRPTEDPGLTVDLLLAVMTSHRHAAETAPWRPDTVPLPMVVQPDALDGERNHGLGRGYASDAGFDLYSSTAIDIAPGATVDVPCGVSLQFPDGVWGMIVGRSSTLRTHNLLVNLGMIDTGYRGPLFANVRNMNGSTFRVQRGMRLAQIIPLPNLAAGMQPMAVDQLQGSDRGTAGFGSSGV